MPEDRQQEPTRICAIGNDGRPYVVVRRDAARSATAPGESTEMADLLSYELDDGSLCVALGNGHMQVLMTGTILTLCPMGLQKTGFAGAAPEHAGRPSGFSPRERNGA